MGLAASSRSGKKMCVVVSVGGVAAPNKAASMHGMCFSDQHLTYLLHPSEDQKKSFIIIDRHNTDCVCVCVNPTLESKFLRTTGTHHHFVMLARSLDTRVC